MYIGGKQFSLRSRASNFTLDDIAELVRFANAHQAKVHVTVNLLPHDEDLDGLSDYLQALDKAGVHAIIVASPAIMNGRKRLDAITRSTFPRSIRPPIRRRFAFGKDRVWIGSF